MTRKYNCKPVSLRNTDTEILNKMLAKENSNTQRDSLWPNGFPQSTRALEHLKVNTQNVISIDYKREAYHHPNGCIPHNRTMVPKCIHALVPVACEYVTGHGRSYFADVIKWGSWGVDVNPRLPEWTKVITKVHRSGRQENEHEEKEMG